MSATYDPNLEIIIEGWGGKQGFHFPTWKLRWFVLQKKPTAADSEEIEDTRDYFAHSGDSFERAHNYNCKTDKVNLVLYYLTDNTKTDLKEVFAFDENTCWMVQKSRVTCPKYSQGQIESIHLFCNGSRGAHKLIFIPFWGFVEPSFKLMCQPWSLCMEFGKPKAYDGENDTYFGDFTKVDEDTFGRTQKDLEKRLDTFTKMFEDDLIFKDQKENMMMGLKLMVPIKFFGKNAQEDNKAKDAEDAKACIDKQTDFQMRFGKKCKELNVQKESVGGRPAWLKLKEQARSRSVTFETWMKIKDDDGRS